MITVITPTIIGRENMLKACIASVSEQSMPATHLVIQDTKKIGAPRIRNDAVESVSTEWVLFLDDDDLLEKTHIEKLQPYLNDYDVILTWPSYTGTPMQPTWLYKEFDPKILDEWCPWSQCAAVRRSKYLEVGGQPEGVVYEDWALWKKLRDNGAKFKVVPEVLWTHHWHEGQRTKQDIKNYQAGKLTLN